MIAGLAAEADEQKPRGEGLVVVGAQQPHTVIHGRNPERGSGTVSAIEVDGGNAHFVPANLADPADVRRLSAAAREVASHVNHAGIYDFGQTGSPRSLVTRDAAVGCPPAGPHETR
ncbi:hypothetical protein GCM10010464_27280 [Pseudonocardia yunnanensis]